MKQFSITHLLIGLAFVGICLGWYNSELARKRQTTSHLQGVENLIATFHEDSVRKDYPTFSELTSIAGTQIESYPEFLKNSQHTIIQSIEFSIIKNRKRVELGVMQTIDNLDEHLDPKHPVDVYSLDLNHPDNTGGRDMFFVYAQRGLILVAYRTVDETGW